MVCAHSPTNRNLPNLVRNALLGLPHAVARACGVDDRYEAFAAADQVVRDTLTGLADLKEIPEKVAREVAKRLADRGVRDPDGAEETLSIVLTADSSTESGTDVISSTLNVASLDETKECSWSPLADALRLS